MTKNPRPEEEKIIKGTRNLFRLREEIKGIRYIIFRNIKNFFEYEKEVENWYKPVRVNNFWNNSYIKYKGNSDENKILSVEEHLDKIRPYLRDILNDLKQSDAWKIQLAVAINSISCKDDNEIVSCVQ